MLQYFIRKEKANILSLAFLHLFYFAMALSKSAAMHLIHSENQIFLNH